MNMMMVWGCMQLRAVKYAGLQPKWPQSAKRDVTVPQTIDFLDNRDHNRRLFLPNRAL